MPELSNSAYIDMLYRGVLGRPADRSGLKHFTALLEHHSDLRFIIDALINSTEYRNRAKPRQIPLLKFSALEGETLTIVDVGAQALYGEEHIYQPLLKSGIDCLCIGFEPLAHRRAERVAKEGSDRLRLYGDFIGDGTPQTFYINNDDPTSSLLPLNDGLNASFNHLRELRTVRTERIQTSRLDEVLSDVEAVDFLKLDIQGFELSALKGAQLVLGRTQVIHCEVEFGPIYRDQPLFSEVEQFLRSVGFYFVDLTKLARYSYPGVAEPTGKDERLLWGDALFLRNLDNDGSAHRHANAQAAIVSLIFQKYGLAQDLMARYPAR